MENITTTEYYSTTVNDTQENEPPPTFSSRDLSGLQDGMILHHVVFTLAVISSFIICITSFKSNKIFQCNRNVIVKHWSFIEIVHLVGHISSLLLKAPKGKCPQIFCVLDEAEGILQCTLYMMLILLVLDSFGLRYERFRVQYKEAYKMLIGVIYVFSGLCFVIFSQLCEECLYHNVPQNVAYIYFLLFVFAVGFNVFFLTQDIQASYREEYPAMSVAVIDVTLFLSLPANIWNLASKHLDLNVKAVRYLTRTIEVANPVVLLLIFIIVDRNFRAALCQIVKCQCRRRQYIVNTKRNNVK